MQREITRELVRRLLPGRMAESNKGSYGSVLAAAGSMAYRGAAALCTEGALRGGAGLVYLASVEPVIQLVLSRTPECCACGCRTAANGGIHPQDADALRRWFADRHAVLLAGPGLGESAADVCKALLGRNAPWAGAVLDADALNALAEKVVYTGPVDAYFGYRLGALQYRSVRFETEVLDTDNYQGNAVVNYTDAETPYTRIIEHKHFEFGTQPKTVISREYSAEWKKGDEPYYPVNDEKNGALYQQYKALADAEGGVIFGGRLGEYKYYDMDKVIESALNMVQKVLG